MPKLIGIDYGSKRVGVALTDESGSVAFPKTTLANDRALLPAIVTMIRKENADRVVIGESKNASGEDNPIMADARRFAAELEKHAAVSVHFEPEFYTSKEARRDSESNAVDAQAAAIILNSFIERSKKN